MRDLPARASRAGARIERIERPEDAAPFDGVIADVPCSGSGAWRRAPLAKWRLDAATLEAFGPVQSAILARAAALVRPGGWIAYMTCSILPEENAGRVAPLCDALGVAVIDTLDLSPRPGGHDGFHLSLLERLT